MDAYYDFYMAGWYYTSLLGWLKLHEKQTRVFMHPELNRPCRYMQVISLEQYRRLALETEKYKP